MARFFQAGISGFHLMLWTAAYLALVRSYRSKVYMRISNAHQAMISWIPERSSREVQLTGLVERMGLSLYCEIFAGQICWTSGGTNACFYLIKSSIEPWISPDSIDIRLHTGRTTHPGSHQWKRSRVLAKPHAVHSTATTTPIASQPRSTTWIRHHWNKEGNNSAP